MRRDRRAFGRVRMVLLALFLVSIAVGVWLGAASGLSDPQPPPAAVVRGPQSVRQRPQPVKPPRHVPPPGIQLIGAKPLRVRFKNPPRTGLLFDVRTGQVLWSRRPLKRVPIASTTKMMTAILTVENTRPRENARVTREATHYEGSGVGVLKAHKRVPVEGLLAGMLLPSGNDAALALAGHIAGNNRRFAKLMNRRARSMGLGCTHYVSADGIEDGNRSCAADLAAIARVAIAKRRIARLAHHEQLHISFPGVAHHTLWLNSTNPLLHLGYPGTIGLKTGYTEAAGHCFVGIVRRGSREFGVVLLNSPDTGRQAVKLLNAAFAQR